MKALSPGQARVLLYLQENAVNGECYCLVQQIAEAVHLNRSSVTQATSHLVKIGFITRERMWELDAEGEPEWVPRLLPEDEVRGIQDHYYPAGNRYKILHSELIDGVLNYVRRTVIMSTCEEVQLSLPFPPFEKTIVAPGATFSPGQNVARELVAN